MLRSLWAEAKLIDEFRDNGNENEVERDDWKLLIMQLLVSKASATSFTVNICTKIDGLNDDGLNEES